MKNASFKKKKKKVPIIKDFATAEIKQSQVKVKGRVCDVVDPAELDQCESCQ